MKKILFLMGVLFMSGSLMAAPVKLVVFGDSLSVGHKIDKKASFWYRLNEELKKEGQDVVVMNASKSGETTAGGLKRIKGVSPADGVILELGINDALQNLDLKKTRENLQSIISSFKKKNVPVLLVGMEAPLTAAADYRDEFRKMYVDLATDNELLLYPFFMAGLWTEDGQAVSADYFIEDKRHPSAKGVDVMVQGILPAVKQFLVEDVKK